MKLLLESVAHLSKVVGCLSILCGTAGFCLGFQFRKCNVICFLKLFLPCNYVHGKLLEVQCVCLEKLIQHCDIAGECNLMSFQYFYNLFNVDLCFVVFCLKLGNRVCRLVEKLHQSFLFLQSVETFQFCYQVGQSVSNCTQILGSYTFKCTV